MSDLKIGIRTIERAVPRGTGGGASPLAAGVAALATAAAAHAQTVIYVDDDSPGGYGYSWSTAFNDLQDALNRARWDRWDHEIEIRIAQGRYVPPTDEPSGDAAYILPADQLTGSAMIIRLFGGYAGFGSPAPDARQPDLYVTLLDGDVDQNDDPNGDGRVENRKYLLRIEPDYPCVTSGCVLALGQRISIDGVKFANAGTGSSDATALSVQGPAIVSLTNCEFFDNDAGPGPGAAIAAGTEPFGAPSVELFDCRFIRNLSQSGGAVRVTGDRFFAWGCEFRANTAFGPGGALWVGTEQTAEVINSTFVGNAAATGAAISAAKSSLIGQCQFVGGFALPGRSVVDVYGVHNEITCCAFVSPELTQGAPVIDNSGPTPVRLRNTVFWDLRARPPATHPDIAFCLLEVATPGLLNKVGDPRFSIPPTPGADGLFGTCDDPPFDLRPGPFSACIDGGGNDFVPEAVLAIDSSGYWTGFDIAGQWRFVDDPGIADTGLGVGPIVDIGPYEFQGTSCVADIDGDGDSDSIDVGLFLNAYSTGDLTADVNFDGVLNGLDIGAFLSAYHDGC